MEKIKTIITEEIQRLNYYLKSNEERGKTRRVKEIRSDIVKLEKAIKILD